MKLGQEDGDGLVTPLESLLVQSQGMLYVGIQLDRGRGAGHEQHGVELWKMT